MIQKQLFSDQIARFGAIGKKATHFFKESKLLYNNLQESVHFNRNTTEVCQDTLFRVATRVRLMKDERVSEDTEAIIVSLPLLGYAC